MEPIPEVHEAAAQLSELLGDDDLVGRLLAICAAAERALPSCVGVSITMVVDEEPFTITATSVHVRELDAAQYLEGGPCPEAARTQSVVPVVDVLDEHRWQSFAQASAARGVRSTLSVPLRLPDWTVCGSLNLYASDPDAFRDTEALIDQLFGLPVAGAVTNADLAFCTREHARGLPAQLADRAALEQAAGVMMHRRGWSADEARTRIRDAAAQAGISTREAVELVLTLAA